MTLTSTNPLLQLQGYGQSIWIDYLRRSFVANGDLLRLVEEDGLRGMTSNPSIFEKAIGESDDYADELAALKRTGLTDPMEVFLRLAIADIQSAADVLRPVYDSTNGRDGHVSLEVSPYLARDTQRTIEEARRLWRAVDRPNLMIKVPGSPEGLPAISQLLSEGINVNITLLFALERYEEVVEAFLSGLERLAADGGDLHAMASVASFFVSRVDTAVDALLERRIEAATSEEARETLRGLLGKVAIANARVAYERYQRLFRGSRWEELARQGARTQRLLWASTGTKNPRYSDVLYVDELIGPDTVNTVPPATLDAFRLHGRPRASLTEDLDGAHRTLDTLEEVGISLDEVTDQLLEDGIRLFAEAFDHLLQAVNRHLR